MKPLLHRPIGESQDEHLRLLVSDFCEMLRWNPIDYQPYTLFEFLDIAMKGGAKGLTLDHIALPGILDWKMEKLRDQEIFQIFRELKNDDTSKIPGDITLIEFLKRHFAALHAPTKNRPLTDQEFDIKLIRRRRENGSL